MWRSRRSRRARGSCVTGCPARPASGEATYPRSWIAVVAMTTTAIHDRAQLGSGLGRTVRGGHGLSSVGLRRTADCASDRDQVADALVELAPATRLPELTHHCPHTR